MYEILFHYGLFTITTFSVSILIAFIVGIIFLIRFVKLKKIKLSFFVNNFIYFIIFPLIGGRLFYIIEHFSVFQKNILYAFAIWDFGFSPYGICYSAILTLFIFSKKKREDFWGWLDAFVLSGLTGLFFIHIGHFFDGTQYGLPTDLPWGITFDTFNIPFITPIHPTQLYAALATFIVLGISMKIVKRTHLTGIAGTLAAMLYSISAFGINFLHGSPSTYSKINYLLIAAIAFIFYIHCSHKKLFN